MFRRLVLSTLLGLSLLASGCGADGGPQPEDFARTEDDLTNRTDAQVKAALELATQGLSFMSESDSPFQFVLAELAPGERLTSKSIRSKLSAMVDADERTDKPIANLGVDVRTFEDWFASFANHPDEPADPELEAYFAQMRTLKKALKDNLRDLRVYRFGKKMRGGQVEGGVSIFIVGRTPSGKLAGVFTVSIET